MDGPQKQRRSLPWLSLTIMLPSIMASNIGECQDIQPPNSSYTCSQQLHWGKCNEAFMLGTNKSSFLGYCALTCGRCTSNDDISDSTAKALAGQEHSHSCACYDAPFSSNETCETQAARGQCRTPSMLGASKLDSHGSCAISCRACPSECLQVFAPMCPCSDEEPAELGISCADVVARSMCSDNAITTPRLSSEFGYCMASCKRCLCTDVVPPGSTFSCPEQAAFGKCSAPWMTMQSPNAPKGYCEISCSRCNLARECPRFAATVAAAPKDLKTCSPSSAAPVPLAASTSPPLMAAGFPPPDTPSVQYNLPPPSSFRLGL